jgi:hypothetical protein
MWPSSMSGPSFNFYLHASQIISNEKAIQDRRWHGTRYAMVPGRLGEGKYYGGCRSRPLLWMILTT